MLIFQSIRVMQPNGWLQFFKKFNWHLQIFKLALFHLILPSIWCWTSANYVFFMMILKFEYLLFKHQTKHDMHIVSDTRPNKRSYIFSQRGAPPPLSCPHVSVLYKILRPVPPSLFLDTWFMDGPLGTVHKLRSRWGGVPPLGYVVVP